MFGFQRIGDFIWAAADARAKGFLFGGTAGRTTLAGEGLQHQDGQSHVLALSVPSVRAYDPAFAYEMAVIVRDGMRKMYVEGEDIFYYITVMNEKYKMPSMPKRKTSEEAILKGMYKYKGSQNNSHNLNLLGSGCILNETLTAADILKKEFDINANVWSVTGYKQLYDDAIEVQRKNRLKNQNKKNYIQETVGTDEGIFVAASDYLKALPLSVSKWFPGPFTALGTDGYGQSDHRDELRDHFEVDARHIVWAALVSLHQNDKIEKKVLTKAKKKLNIQDDKPSPAEY